MNASPVLRILRSGLSALVPLALAAAASAQELPRTMIWSSYDVGSAGYSEASAIADALGQKYGTKVRIQPSGSGIGRLQPVLMGRADFGFLSTESFFVSEGIYDFATPDWGPRSLRTVAGRPASFSMVAAADAGIETVSDAKGKRIALVAGNPSLNTKCEGILAFGNLTLDDVKVVMFPTYSAAMASMTKGESDATCTTATVSQLYELAESPRGLHWVAVDPSNTEGWARLKEVSPMMGPFEESIAAGLKDGEKVWMTSYRYPVIVSLAEKSDDEVYAFIKALDETFGTYKDATATMNRWDLHISGQPPVDIPFHEGAIRYLREKGIWTEENQKWNDQRLARMNALTAAWATFLPEHKDMAAGEFADAWLKRRAEVVATLSN
ncbi:MULTISPECIES: TAXI family TRAP transporter solute-binding subunit [Haematobacter]|uniref:C4-dicarboxylate ABC transporter substrate-binding protein n=1 Tax=Haematobacter genomosp. 1 TaxID=366618 RepID=A0A212AB89_9RHOB|nr:MULTISPECIES: TAXI family TRAP transporter solute-binding subunit [Haematobacter]OWJ77901.1 C4-dicarboxylate ABC transporter substrate-binding protein [Haematobacter genomosp. 1]